MGLTRASRWLTTGAMARRWIDLLAAAALIAGLLLRATGC